MLHGTLPLSTHLVLRARAECAGPTPRSGHRADCRGNRARDSLAVASPRQLAGDGLLLLEAFSWSTYGMLARRFGRPPASTAALVAVLSLRAFLPFYAVWAHKALF